MLTERLELRLPKESDRARFVELFGDEQFMTFSGAALDPAAAGRRFDGMLATAAELPFAKLGFTFWKQALVAGFLDNLYRRQVGQA